MTEPKKRGRGRPRKKQAATEKVESEFSAVMDTIDGSTDNTPDPLAKKPPSVLHSDSEADNVMPNRQRMVNIRRHMQSAIAHIDKLLRLQTRR